MTDKPALIEEEGNDIRLSIQKVDGRQQIIFKKSILKGKVTSNDVLNTILIAARLQAEKFVEKLSRGATLDKEEIKSLKELAEITKLETKELPQKGADQDTITDANIVKTTLYKALMEKSSENK